MGFAKCMGLDMSNFKKVVYVDSPFSIHKQEGSFADPYFYVYEQLGEGDYIGAGKYPTLEAAKEDIAVWLEEMRKNSGL